MKKGPGSVLRPGTMSECPTIAVIGKVRINISIKAFIIDKAQVRRLAEPLKKNLGAVAAGLAYLIHHLPEEVHHGVRRYVWTICIKYWECRAALLPMK